MVPTPQLGSGSTGTASSAPGDAAQPKALVGCPNKRGRRKGESGRQTAAATEARVAQEARDFVLNAPVPPKEPKFAPDSSGMDLRPDSNCLWLSADHNREQPKPRPNHFLPASGVHFLHGKHPPHVLFCAERACGACCFFVLPAPRAQGPPEQGARNYKEEQQDKAKGRRGTTTKAGAAAQSWELGAEQQEHQLGSTQHAAPRSSAARRLRLHLRLPGAPTKNRALSEPPSESNSPAELAVLVLVPAICPLGCFQLALRALDWRAAPCPRRLLRPSGSGGGGVRLLPSKPGGQSHVQPCGAPGCPLYGPRWA